MKAAIASEAVKSAPPVTVLSFAWLQDWTISNAVGLATLAYLGLQALYLLWRWRREARAGK